MNTSAGECVLGDFILSRPVKNHIDRRELVTFLGMEDIAEGGGVIAQHLMLASEVKSGLTTFQRNDVLVAKITPCFENGKGACLDRLETMNGFGSTEFHVLRAKPTADARYIFYQTQVPEFRRQLEGEMIGSAGQKRVPISAIEKYKLPVRHSLSEQRAIVAALSDVDTLTTRLEQLIVKKRALKQAIMQQLLTGKQRLSGFHGKWVYAKLGDYLKRQPKYGINAPAVAYSERLPTYIRISDVTQDGRFSPEKFVSVNHTQADRYYLNDGDIVIARTGASVGKSYRYQLCDGKLVFAGFLICITVDESKLLSEYLAAYLQTDAYWTWVRVVSMRSGQPGINSKEYAQLPLPVPPIDEQRAIANILSDMDAEIAALEQKRHKTRLLKQGMMQELLTGRRRLV